VAVSEFRTPGKFVFGAGALETLGAEARRLGARAVLVVGRRAMQETGIAARCLKLLSAAGVEAILFEGVEPEPKVATVDRCRAAVRTHRADVVIGLGGGSALDAAKVAAGLAAEDEPTAAFHAGGRTITRPGVAMIAVPTTSGTGSEMTVNGVLSDPERCVKTSVRHPSFMPAVALVDPEVTVSSPPRVTASSGIDALVQALESYLSKFSTPMTEALSLRAAEALVRALPAVVSHGEDLALRTHAAWGSAMAGIALANAKLGIIHGIAHPVGMRFGVPHGLACGVLLPAGLEFNRPAAGEKWAVLAHLLGGDPVTCARRLLEQCGLPARLTDYRPDAAAFGAVAEEAVAGSSMRSNPRPVVKEDVVAILRTVA
jgi:alcohol dehydrogenase class IV